MKKMLLIFILTIWITSGIFPKDALVLPELSYPKNILVSGDRIFITEYPHVYVYSMKDFRLMKKIGNRGEGPGEFYIDEEWMDRKIMGLVSSIQSDTLYVNSMGRLSLFSFDGQLITSQRTHPFQGGYYFKPINRDSYIGFKQHREGTSLVMQLIKYNARLEKVKEIYRCPFWIRDRNIRKINFFERANTPLQVQIDQSYIYLVQSGRDRVEIEILYPDGKKIRTISKESEKIPITEKFVTRVHNYFKLKFKRGLEHNIKNTEYGEFFPAIRQFRVSDGKIYVFTYKRSEQNNEVIILDQTGKILIQKMIPLKENNPEHLFPFTISNNKIFQLSENIEEESWELAINPL